MSLWKALKAKLGGGAPATPPPAQGQPTGWSVATVKKDGIVREVSQILTETPVLPAGCSMRTAALIQWTYGEEGMPPKPILDAMYAFEDAILDLEDESDLVAVRVCVRTSFGVRSWLYYTVDQTRFMARFNRLLAGHAPYPLEIVFGDDPEWKAWHEALAELNLQPDGPAR